MTVGPVSKPRRRLKLAVLGDPHLAIPRGADDPLLDIDGGLKLHRESPRLLAAAIEAVNAEPDVDSALVLGDLTRDSELFNHEAAAELLSALRVPLYIVAGNHDMLRARRVETVYADAPRLDREEFAQFWRGRGLPNATTRYTASLGQGVELIVLDTNLTLRELAARGLDAAALQDHGFVDAEQLAWLEVELARVLGSGHLPLVAAHHSVMDQSPAEAAGHALLSIFGFWQVRQSSALREVLRRHNVPLVLSGHLHAQSVNSDGSGAPPVDLTNIACAALVSYPHTWGVLTVDGDAVSYESRSLAPWLPDGFLADSRAASNAGIGALIAHELRSHPLLGTQARGVADMVMASDWWPRLCDGTLQGFSVDPSLLPSNPLLRVAYGKVASLLNEYGAWKSLRGDPNSVRIEL